VAAPPGGAGSREARRRLEAVRDRFLSSAVATAPVRPVVADSWRRCADAGVCFDGSRLPAVPVAGDDLARRRAGHPLAPLLPMLRDLLGEGAGGGHIFAVGDADGTLLWVQGPAGTLRRAERMRFVAGAQWAEAYAGTNAPGTALAIGGPVQVLGAEHFNATVRPWSCAAAPVRDPDSGRMIGVLDLTGGAEIGAPQALALVRATARAAEAELAREVALADARARTESGRMLAAGPPAALVSPGGRVLDATPGLDLTRLPGVPPDGLLPDGRRVVIEPVGSDGHLAVRFVDGPPAPGAGSALGLAALGRDAALLQVDGHTLRLRPRHGEILVVLASTEAGVSAGRLAVQLCADELAGVTLRAEMSRLRAVLGGGLLASMPYRLTRPLRADFQVVGRLLGEGRVAEALALYPGPLLPASEAPAVVELRTALEQQLRGAVLASGDPGLLRRWVESSWASDDAYAWRRLADALPGGSAQRAAAAARARALRP
jgi:hypothetical protein